MDIKKECEELNVNFSDLCKMSKLGQLIQKAKKKNSKQDVINMLLLLNCNNILSHGREEDYLHLDIHDKEIQHNMLNHDAKILYNFDYHNTEAILEMVYKDSSFIYKLKKKKSTEFSDIYFEFLIKVKKFIEKYKDFNADQYNINNYINDSHELEHKIKVYLFNKIRLCG